MIRCHFKHSELNQNLSLGERERNQNYEHLKEPERVGGFNRDFTAAIITVNIKISVNGLETCQAAWLT